MSYCVVLLLVIESRVSNFHICSVTWLCIKWTVRPLRRDCDALCLKTSKRLKQGNTKKTQIKTQTSTWSKALVFCSTHNGVTPEFSHLADPHGGQQCLPDVQFKHVADHNLHGRPHRFAVVYHCAIIIAQLGAEVERHLEQKWRTMRLAC